MRCTGGGGDGDMERAFAVVLPILAGAGSDPQQEDRGDDVQVCSVAVRVCPKALKIVNINGPEIRSS